MADFIIKSSIEPPVSLEMQRVAHGRIFGPPPAMYVPPSAPADTTSILESHARTMANIAAVNECTATFMREGRIPRPRPKLVTSGGANVDD